MLLTDSPLDRAFLLSSGTNSESGPNSYAGSESLECLFNMLELHEHTVAAQTSDFASRSFSIRLPYQSTLSEMIFLLVRVFRSGA